MSRIQNCFQNHSDSWGVLNVISIGDLVWQKSCLFSHRLKSSNLMKVARYTWYRSKIKLTFSTWFHMKWSQTLHEWFRTVSICIHSHHIGNIIWTQSNQWFEKQKQKSKSFKKKRKTSKFSSGSCSRRKRSCFHGEAKVWDNVHLVGMGVVRTSPSKCGQTYRVIA